MERLSIDEVIEHCNKTCDMTEKIAKARGHELESIQSKQFWEHYQVREWLEELKQYRAIGTVEEFKALKEKSVAKKAEVNEFDYGEGYVCGECESFLHYVDDDDEHIRTNYCCHCGTKIDWQ